MKPLYLSLFFLFITTLTFAQDNVPYAEKAAQLQKEIWGTTAPEFKVTKVPDSLSKESAVVLARSFSLNRTSNTKIKFLIITAAASLRTVKLKTFHERVKINDKVSLEDYSTLEYQKKLDKTVSFFLTKFVSTNNTFIGAKIVKPNGSEVIVNTGEEVLTKNETKDQKGKLAIPGLQVGDILDYYVSTVDVDENSKNASYKNNDDIFVLADEYPVLYYSLDFQYNKKTDVKYIYANGAPHFDGGRNADGDLVLSLKLHNMPKYQSNIWVSALRQYPYIEIGSTFNNGADASYDTRAVAIKKAFKYSFEEYSGFNEAEKRTKDYFNTGKPFKNNAADSVFKVLYDIWKFQVFCNYDGDELENIDGMNYRSARSVPAAIGMSMMLTQLGINHDVLMVASRISNTLDNMFTFNDFDAIIRIKRAKTYFMSFDNVVTHFGEVPERFEGEKVIALNPDRITNKYYTFTEKDDSLSVSASDKNFIDEQLQVNLLSTDMQKLKITRQVSESGFMRLEDQKSLLPAGDIDKGLQTLIKGEELSKRIKGKHKADEYSNAFEQQRKDQLKAFTAEIKGKYDQEPTEVKDCRIIDPAIENTNPAFKYSSSFVLNNMVKKAGNNYLVDVGKLTGGFYKLDDTERKRTIDVYMPCARSFKYTISLAIPQGYTAKGVEELNIKKENKTGSFSSTASINGNTLNIVVTRAYTHNFEKAADWPALVEMIDAAAAYNAKKILLEKK
ncbi:hypothetical protein PQ469_07665 [Mucilaginibacter sp. KACC 22773]|uniref:hypothetical protein n=1 Tax=Mucilaginibacter sp. KACC 22773 TaxID=3025671 RepID=UPI0023668D38|nr:hypothetical protein [Mucilaginibacter sp. KACC 22773]WDF79883.1 hypothetical protein PQ469_07665 [Mucilaginibacter sp. KACC 22773]